MGELFDMELRARRRDRAARSGPELFLYERVFADCLDRLALVQRRFRRALLLGCPDHECPARLQDSAEAVDVRDPGQLFAQAAGGQMIVEDAWMPDPGTYDLVVAIGTLDTVNHLTLALRLLFEAMTEDALLIGAISGGETLPKLRAAMRAADAVAGAASAHVHPRIEASALAPLLTEAGFTMPVVDIDRVNVTYGSFERLVGDLRAMGATNVLRDRARRPLSRAAHRAAADAFRNEGAGGRTSETFEILHFAAWRKPRENG
jgi:NADH dehydrogenase [ubiquinone] 1 alpha subcomplex assembly factor 5